MKSVLKKIFVGTFALSGLVLAGCYTEVATRDTGNDYPAYTESDTSVDGENITINNHYYLDDDYRRSRFRLSFNYYYPSYHSSWIASYYYSYYNDWYWGWRRPFYYNDWCYHPNPYWYPGYVWNPYYDPYYYPYPYYYPSPVYGYTPPANPGRVRDNGPSRDITDPGGRTRPLPSAPSPGTTVASSPRVHESVPVNEAQPAKGGRVRDEVPWWERANKERPRTDNVGSRAGNEEAKPIDRRRESPSVATPKPKSPKEEARPVERRRDNPRRYTPPRKDEPKQREEAKPVERPRERQQPAYNPPPKNNPPPPSYNPPPQNDGGRTRGTEGNSGSSGGRKRAD